MFVALRIKDRLRVTSIAREWDEAEEVLREWTSSGELVCPGCEQPLWLRTGGRRRRHFAHRSLANCPLEHQSVEVMEVKAQLYWWLETKYPGKVNVDISLGVPGYERNLDLVVEAEEGRKLGYWVFDRQQREREQLLSYGALQGVSLQVIHTASTLSLQADEQILLSASQRDFIECSDFDRSVGWTGGGHLHFFDAEASSLSIYRGLHCVHGPNVYAWRARRSGVLDSALLSPRTGEIVFPQDVEARQAWRERQRPKPAPTPEPKPVEEPVVVEVEAEQEPEAVEVVEESEPEEAPEATAQEEEPRPNFNGPYRCEVCGAMTTDWSEAAPAAGTCICRSCVKGRKARPEQGQRNWVPD